MPSLLLTVDLMWRWAPEPKVMIPAINSNKDFIKLFNMPSLILTVDLMWRWTPEPKDLIPAINSNTLVLQICRLFCSLWIKNNGPLDSRIQGFDPGHKFKQRFHQIILYAVFFCSLWIQIDNGPLDSRTQGYDSGPHFKQGFHRTLRLINCSLWI